MSFSAWLSILVRNHFAITPRRWGMALIIFCYQHHQLRPSGRCRRLFFGRRIRNTAIPEEPIFVIGHWRSGTTLLHELLVLDPRHTYADTYACFAAEPFPRFGLVFSAAG